MNTVPSIEKSSFGWPLKPLAVPRPHSVQAAASACGVVSTGRVGSVSATRAAGSAAARLSGISNSLCDNTSAPDTRRNCTGARNVPSVIACGVAAWARSKPNWPNPEADAFLTELEAGADDRLPKTAGDAQRLRLMLEGRTAWALSEASHLTPIFEIGGRWDGGKAETGVGAELSGGFEYAHTKLGLDIEARGRYLLAHQKSAFDEWGASLTLKLDPGADKQGLWLALAPVWGAEASQVEQMWGSAEALRAGAETDTTPGLSPEQVEFDVGYGVMMHEGTGLLTTYGGVSTSGPASHGYRVGGRIELGEWVDLSVEGERTTRGRGAEHQVALYGHLGW